jgi:UDP-N-acetylmuramyl pentapeptide synthase
MGWGSRADFRASNYRAEFTGTSYQLDARGKSYLVRLPLIGRFNVTIRSLRSLPRRYWELISEARS